MCGARGWSERALIAFLALLLDFLLGEPPNALHPVAWLGKLIARLEALAPARDGRGRLAYGGLLTGLVGGLCVLAGSAMSRALARRPIVIRLALAAASLKLSLSLRELTAAAERTRLRLDSSALDKARRSLRELVSRPVVDLGSAQITSAAIESLSENLSDSLIAPLTYYLLFGLPGAFAYRAVNTLDAMIGYHGEYEELGRAAACLDDLVNLLPARLTALLIVATAGLGGGDGRAALATLKRDCRLTESPNAGWPMSAAAGALRIQLEKPGYYRLGSDFPEPSPGDIRRATRLCVAAAALGLTLAITARQLRPERSP